MWCVLAACGGSDGPTGPITAHVTHYDYHFDIDSRAAHAQVTTTVDVGGDCIDLPFRADGLDGMSSKIDGESIVRGGVGAGVLTLCGHGHSAGEALTLDVDMVIPVSYTHLTLPTILRV